MNSGVYFKRKPIFEQDLFKPVVLLKVEVQIPSVCTGSFWKTSNVLTIFNESLYCFQRFLMKTSMFINI